MLMNRFSPSELPQLCFNFLFLVIRPLVSANNFVTDNVDLLFKSRVAPRILTPNISLLLMVIAA